MSLYTLSIRRPVLATVMSFAIIIFGVIGFFFLGVREYPAVEPPIISVSTSYRGANADVIDAQITEPLEESINGIEGIRTLSSVSREGRSSLSVEFNLGTDLERAANDVRDRVSRAMGNLPQDVDPPIVSKADADGQPIVFLNIRSRQRDLLELSDIADNTFKERLQTIPGVSRVDIWGEKRYAMRMWIDPQKLAAYALTPLDIRTALSRANVELPSGRIEGADVELTVRTMGRLMTEEDFNNLIVKQSGAQIVRFRDVGRAELGALNDRTVLKRDGTPMVGIVVRPLPGANYIDIVDQFYERVEVLKKDLPADIELGIGFDNTEQVRQSISEVQQTIFIAFLLVVLIIFLFLRDWRTTLIPVLVIPVSLIGAFFIMYLMGYSINVLTLLAIVLAIGIVVDDAIVVLENIYKKIEAGVEPIRAGIEGTREIFFAVIATTLALASVFLPILFMGGLVGRLFREFGVVLAGAVIISSFVALTLTPMLATRLLKHRDKPPWFYGKTEPFFQWLTATYSRSLGTFMDRRWKAFALMAVCAGLIALFYNILPAELAPLEDRGNARMFASAPEGVTFEYMDAYMNRLIGMVQDEVPETEAIISVTSPGFGAAGSVNSGFAFLILNDPDERERSQQEIVNTLMARVNGMTGARVFVSQEETISVGRFGGLPVQYVLQASNIQKLKDAIPPFLDAVGQDPVFAFADVDLKFNKPELRVTIERDRAESMGVSPLDVAQTMQLALSEQRIGYFIRNGQQYQIIGQVDRDSRSSTLDLRSLYVRTATGEAVSLDNLVTVREESSPPQLYRFNRYVSATVSAQLNPGYTVADGIEAMDRIAADVLDESFSTTLTGASRDFVESSGSIMFVFMLALILIYLVLAAQFESFRDPFTILLTVPMALTGALLFLWYFGQSLNIFSQIGIVMLIGLVTKNGILIVEFANQKRASGLSIINAAREAAVARFRPILMTTLSTILGILPIALALGAGAESRKPMGIAVIGGLLVGTMLTLYVIPVMYTMLTSRTGSTSMTATLAGDGATAELAASERTEKVGA
jgi:multidrug efflux pump